MVEIIYFIKKKSTPIQMLTWEVIKFNDNKRQSFQFSIFHLYSNFWKLIREIIAIYPL